MLNWLSAGLDDDCGKFDPASTNDLSSKSEGCWVWPVPACHRRQLPTQRRGSAIKNLAKEMPREKEVRLGCAGPGGKLRGVGPRLSPRWCWQVIALEPITRAEVSSADILAEVDETGMKSRQIVQRMERSHSFATSYPLDQRARTS